MNIPRSHSLSVLQFGWSRKQPPVDFHIVASPDSVGDVFERFQSPEELKKHLYSLIPAKTLIDKLAARFTEPENPASCRGFALDIPNSLGISEFKGERINSSSPLLHFFDKLYDGLFQKLKPFYETKGQPIAYERCDYWPNGNGTLTPVDLNSVNTPERQGNGPAVLQVFRQPNQRMTSLHWDVNSFIESSMIPRANSHLALWHGKRENIEGGLNMYTDFSHWYQDQGFEKPLASLSEREVAELVLANSETLEREYTITLPPNEDSHRLSIFLQSPQMNGLLHGVTPMRVIDPNKKAERDLFRKSFGSKAFVTEQILRSHMAS